MLRSCLLCSLFVPLNPAQITAQTDSLSVDSVYFLSESVTDTSDDETTENELQLKVKGFLDTYHAVRTQGMADFMASRTRARGELTLEKGEASLFVSLNAIYNSLLKERTGLELREAYLDYEKGLFDLRAGRQIIVWGVADALRITDCVSPFDYSEFLAQDYDDIRIPVNALRAKLNFRSVSLEMVCIPVSEFFILPTDRRNPWAVCLPAAELPYTIDLESRKPAHRLRNMEFGGRASINLSGLDFSFCALQSWNKMPALSTSLSADRRSLNVTGIYHRMTMFGADCSLPLGRFVVRGEMAYYLNEMQSANVGYQPMARNTFNGLLGVDWFAGNDWNLSMQYSHKYIAGDLVGLSVFRNAGLATMRISKELLRNTLKLSTFAYVDVANGGIFNRCSAAYSLNDQIEFTAGYDYFHADAGVFRMYKDNSEGWVKIKYSF